MDLDRLSTWMTQTHLFGIPALSWCIAITVAVVTYLVLVFVLGLVLRRVRRRAETTPGSFDDDIASLLGATSHGLLLLVSLLVGLGLLDLPARWADRVSQLWFVAVVLQFALWAGQGIRIFLRRYTARHGTAAGQPSATATLISWALRSLLWSVAALAVLSNLGVNITAFIASLGIGGIAVALAAQNVLGDLFASVSIAVDKPFEVGDGVAVGDVSGTVEHVGLKTTRIRSVTGEQVVMSNTELLKKTLRNYKRQRDRRVVLTFGVALETEPEQAASIPALVRSIIQSSDKVRFDRAHFKGIGAGSLDYEVVYVVLEPSYDLYMDLQQQFNLALMRELRSIGVRFAVPTRSVHVMDDRREADEDDARRVVPRRPMQVARSS